MRTDTLHRLEKTPQAIESMRTESNKRIARLFEDLETAFDAVVKVECDVFASMSRIKEISLGNPKREEKEREPLKSVLKDFKWSISELEKSQRQIMDLLRELSVLLSNTKHRTR